MDIHKIKGELGDLTIEEMDAMDESELKTRVVEANTAMQTVKEELDENEAYQTAKTACSDLSAGKKAVDKRQKAVIGYALSRLTELGKLGIRERMDWDAGRAKVKAKLAIQAAKKAEESAEESEEENE